MKKGNTIIIAVVVAIVVIGGGYALLHKSSKPAATATTQNSSKNSAPAVNNSVLITKTSSALGQYLADPNDKTLYTYAGDTSGVSNCTGSCLATWPAYVDTGSTSNLPTGISTIKRSDNGEIQYTYNGMPLYYFASDTVGQVTGNGVSNFQVAKPAAASSSASNSAPSSNSQPASNSNSSSNYSSY